MIIALALLLLTQTTVLSAVLTWNMLRYAIRHGILDVPNERSSHVTPTPRGGGLAIVGAAISSIAVAAIMGLTSRPLVLALVPGGVLIAAAGWIDDRRGLNPFVRLAIQLLAAASAVATLGYIGVLTIGNQQLVLGPTVGRMLTMLGLVWFTNLFNFMDGIDGIAAAEATAVGAAMACLAAWRGDVFLAVTAAIVAAAAAGFLRFNWHPARIFMGDVGSGFLGYSLGVIAVAADVRSAVPITAFLLLASVFVFDASVTLVRRLLARQRVMTAHREHAYQRAAREWGHRSVTTWVSVINAFVTALAILGVAFPQVAAGAMLFALAMLAILYMLLERRSPMTFAQVAKRAKHP